jgi:hypothetical protein
MIRGRGRCRRSLWFLPVERHELNSTTTEPWKYYDLAHGAVHGDQGSAAIAMHKNSVSCQARLGNGPEGGRVHQRGDHGHANDGCGF